MDYSLTLMNCQLLGSGAEGSVYLTNDGLALKSFNTVKAAENEVLILKAVEDSRFFPKVLLCVSNIVIREYVDGKNLSEYIEINGLSYKISTEIIDLIEDLKNHKFKRLNIRNAHLFVDDNERLMVIDPRKPFSKITPYPKDIIKTLLKHHLFDEFLKFLLAYKPYLLNYWIDGYNYVIHNYTRRIMRY